MMRALLILGISALTSLPPASATAGSIMTGNDLLEFCGHAPQADLPNPSTGYCAGYIRGVYEGLTYSGKEASCPRESVTNGQLIDIVVKALINSPEIRDMPAPSFVAAVIRINFPCGLH